MSPSLAGGFFTTEAPGKTYKLQIYLKYDLSEASTGIMAKKNHPLTPVPEP